MRDKDALIAILEFELAAALAREAMIRERARAVVESAQLPLGPAARTARGNQRAGSADTVRVPKRALIALRSHLALPVDHVPFVRRLHAARYDAMKALADFGIIPPGRVGEWCAAIEARIGERHA